MAPGPNFGAVRSGRTSTNKRVQFRNKLISPRYSYLRMQLEMLSYKMICSIVLESDYIFRCTSKYRIDKDEFLLHSHGWMELERLY